MTGVLDLLPEAIVCAGSADCPTRPTDVLFLHNAAGAVVFVAGVAAAAAVGMLALRWREAEYKWIFGLFSGLIFSLALLEGIDLALIWWPLHAYEAFVEAIVALLAIAAAISLWLLLPRLLKLPTRRELGAINADLASRIEENRHVTEALRTARDELERRVAERTEALLLANADLARKEAYFRESYKRTPAMIYSCDDAGHIVEASDAFLARMGLTREAAIGSQIADLVTEDSLRTLRERDWGETRDGGVAVSDVEIAYRRADGQLIEGEISIVPEDNPLLGRIYLVALVDVTERNKARRGLEAQADYLLRANESLEQFAYVASHDLQEPLRKIVLYADMLNDALAADRKEDVAFAAQVVRDASIRARVLVSDLLTYSRASNRRLELESCRFSTVLGEVMQTLSQSIAESGADIRIEGPEVVLQADRLLIDQLLQNLLSNAIKYTADGMPPRIEISTAVGPRKRLVLRFADHGIGFAEEYSRKIFEPFTRLHGRSRYPGTGIGLAICRAVCERHGWKISASGEVGAGAVFTIEIPRGGYTVDLPSGEAADDV